ncbi:MAG: hypothetical protein ACYCTG_00345 [Ferrimicrobium sp.]|jgi:hypothetical protein
MTWRSILQGGFCSCCTRYRDHAQWAPSVSCRGDEKLKTDVWLEVYVNDITAHFKEIRELRRATSRVGAGVPALPSGAKIAGLRAA